MVPRALVLFGLLFFVCAPALAQDNPDRIELLDHDGLRAAMKQLAMEYPALAETMEIGHSRAGRKIGALRIGAGEFTEGRPAILLVANVEGPYVYTSALALDHARALTANYGRDEGITALLDTTTVYIVPRADPDAAEARFTSPLCEREASGYGVDNDRDGRQGEDGPRDVNGDGVVSWMRVLDPEGTMIADGADERVMVEAVRAKGVRGKWKLLVEGRDLDGDGEVAEDPALDAIVNRNFPHRWAEHEPQAGRYPTDEPAALALCNLVVEHRDIALVLIYGASGNLEERASAQSPGRQGDKRAGGRTGRTPEGGSIEPEGAYDGDFDAYSELTRRYRELTGNEDPGELDEAGTFQAWVYHHRGLLSVAVRPWSVPEQEEAPELQPDPDEANGEAGGGESAGKQAESSAVARRLKWLETNGRPGAHLGWAAFEHPELGPVEIGGFAPYALIEPPPGAMAAVADTHLRFLVELGKTLPRVQVAECKATMVADGLYEVRAAIENEALLPLHVAAGKRTRHLRPLRVRFVQPQGAVLLAGTPMVLVRELDGAGGRTELHWLVQTDQPDAILIEIESDSAGQARAHAEVL